MSIENAILELAAAIRHLADSNREIAATGGAPLTIHGEVCSTLAEAAQEAELEKAVTQVETDAKADPKAEQKKVMGLVEADRKSAAKQAIADALAKAEAEKKATPVVEEDDPLGDSIPLDYEKDVKPKLVQVGKNKQEMVDLLASFGVGKELEYAKADQLPADKFAKVVAACDKILAARG